MQAQLPEAPCPIGVDGGEGNVEVGRYARRGDPLCRQDADARLQLREAASQQVEPRALVTGEHRVGQRRVASDARRKRHEGTHRPEDQVACKGARRASWAVAQGACAREGAEGSERYGRLRTASPRAAGVSPGRPERPMEREDPGRHHGAYDQRKDGHPTIPKTEGDDEGSTRHEREGHDTAYARC